LLPRRSPMPASLSHRAAVLERDSGPTCGHIEKCRATDRAGAARTRGIAALFDRHQCPRGAHLVAQRIATQTAVAAQQIVVIQINVPSTIAHWPGSKTACARRSASTASLAARVLIVGQAVFKAGVIGERGKVVDAVGSRTP